MCFVGFLKIRFSQQPKTTESEGIKSSLTAVYRGFIQTEMSVTVPDGLSELLEEFAVTVLREKPKDLYEFAASYFAELNMSKKQVNVSERASTAEVEMRAGEGVCVWNSAAKSYLKANNSYQIKQ